jgi:hypothetical protein
MRILQQGLCAVVQNSGRLCKLPGHYDGRCAQHREWGMWGTLSCTGHPATALLRKPLAMHGCMGVCLPLYVLAPLPLTHSLTHIHSLSLSLYVCVRIVVPSASDALATMDGALGYRCEVRTNAGVPCPQIVSKLKDLCLRHRLVRGHHTPSAPLCAHLSLPCLRRPLVALSFSLSFSLSLPLSIHDMLVCIPTPFTLRLCACETLLPLSPYAWAPRWSVLMMACVPRRPC